MSTMIESALQFATSAHADQTRKYTGEPYVNHCIEVSDIVREHGGSEAQIAAALLHDTVEDTPVTIDQIYSEFGEEVALLVAWLTDVSKPEDGNRATRKALDREHTFKAPATAQFIKLADLISNTKSISEHDPGFARVYLREKQLLLEGLRASVKQTKLYSIAFNQVEKFLK